MTLEATGHMTLAPSIQCALLLTLQATALPLGTTPQVAQESEPQVPVTLEEVPQRSPIGPDPSKVAWTMPQVPACPCPSGF